MRAAGEKGVCMHQQSAATPPVDTAHWLLRPHRGQVSGASGENVGMVGLLSRMGGACSTTRKRHPKVLLYA